MTINTVADLQKSPANNVDYLGADAAGTGSASAIDTVRQNLGAIIARGYDDAGGVVTVAGSANAITIASNSTYQTLRTGVQIAFKAAAANTTAVTVNVDTLGVRAVRLQGDVALSGGEIKQNGYYELVYDEAYNSAAGAWVLKNPSVAASTLSAASTTEQLTGTENGKYSTPDSVAALWEKGSNVASASTLSLGEGGYFHITGTTTITDIDFATAKDGREATLVFDGILTLTHNATTLILPGGANITTAAGDSCRIRQDSGDNIKVVSYTRADGTALVASSGAGLGTEQATTSGTTKDFAIAAGATRITVEWVGVTVGTDDILGVQLGDSGGVETTGYNSRSSVRTAATNTSRYLIGSSSAGATDVFTGHMVLTRMNSSHSWVASGVSQVDTAGSIGVFSGSKTLSAELTTVRFVTDGSWSAGSVNVVVG